MAEANFQQSLVRALGSSLISSGVKNLLDSNALGGEQLSRCTRCDGDAVLADSATVTARQGITGPQLFEALKEARKDPFSPRAWETLREEVQGEYNRAAALLTEQCETASDPLPAATTLAETAQERNRWMAKYAELDRQHKSMLAEHYRWRRSLAEGLALEAYGNDSRGLAVLVEEAKRNLLEMRATISLSAQLLQDADISFTTLPKGVESAILRMDADGLEQAYRSGRKSLFRDLAALLRKDIEAELDEDRPLNGEE